ncbi:MAG: hypothetical protein ACXVLX_17210 [Ilumatobacteraceae bacterium]
MINTSMLPNGDVLVTFIVDDDRPVSLIGNFNDWDPYRDPFVEELDGRHYVTVSLPADTVACFRYLALGGAFYDDPEADRLEPNGYGETHSVLDQSLRSDALHSDPEAALRQDRQPSPVR